MSCQEEFLAKLRERGFRMTPQREAVLTVLHDLEEHASADEIHARALQLNATVDIATVYRTLELLQEFGLLAVIELGDGLRRYELSAVHGTHHHLRCRRCGALVRIEAAQIEPFLQALQQQLGFRAEAEHLVISGLCQACQAAEACTPSSAPA